MTPLALVQRELQVLEQTLELEPVLELESREQLGQEPELSETHVFSRDCRCSEARLNIFDTAWTHDLGNTLFYKLGNCWCAEHSHGKRRALWQRNYQLRAIVGLKR